MRKSVALLASVTLIAALAACSTDGGAAANCTPRATSGSATQALNITGDFGTVPTVVFPSPLTTSTTERVVISEGTGETAVLGQTVVIDYSIYDGSTGEALQESTFDGTTTGPIPLNETSRVGFVKALECLPVGTRVAAALAPEDAFGAEGYPQAGIAPNTTLVIVADILSVQLNKADGKSQPAVDGFPSVVLDENGVPGITIPKTEAPTEFKLAVLKKGDGPVVQAGATVTVQYTGVVWSATERLEPFDSSWIDGVPRSFNLAEVVPGFTQAIEGQTIGSQVIAIMPPELAYGDQEQATIPAGSTLVFVIDILAAN